MLIAELAKKLGKSTANVLKKAYSLGIYGTPVLVNAHKTKDYTPEEVNKIISGYLVSYEAIPKDKIGFTQVLQHVPMGEKKLNRYLNELGQEREYINIKGKRTRVVSRDILPELESLIRLAPKARAEGAGRKKDYYRISVKAYDGLWYVKEAGLEKKTALKRAKLYCKEGRVIIRSCRGKKWS